MSLARYFSKLAALVGSDGKVPAAALATGAVTADAVSANTITLAKLARVGSAGQVLMSNGAGADPSYQALPAGGVTSLNGQTGAITDTNLYAIGSYVTGRPQNATVYPVNSTLAGSSLYATSGALRWVQGGGWIDLSDTNYFANTNMYTLVNTGTWRCVSPCGLYTINSSSYSTGLWVRIS